MVNHLAIVELSNGLQPLSPSCARLATLAGHQEPDLKEVIDIIAHDPILASKLLRVANSARFASARSVGTVKEGVLRLGTAKVFDVSVRTATRSVIERDVPGYGIRSSSLWKHSMAASMAAEATADFVSVKVSPFSSTAALLHDIGKMILGQFMTQESILLCDQAVKQGGLQPFQAESEILTLHHGEVGGIIAQHWQLPQDIVDGVTHHHSPERVEGVSASVVCLANFVAHEIDGSSIRTGPAQETFRWTSERLGLTTAGFDKLCIDTATWLAEAMNQMGI
ncbi:MAG: HDOD domain-containing protein [Planctomycetes bacterium]|nr:HDOD domain-containing protein [Planctomycetota bacterium]